MKKLNNDFETYNEVDNNHKKLTCIISSSCWAHCLQASWFGTLFCRVFVEGDVICKSVDIVVVVEVEIESEAGVGVWFENVTIWAGVWEPKFEFLEVVCHLLGRNVLKVSSKS
jgi:hypothetical protein